MRTKKLICLAMVAMPLALQAAPVSINATTTTYSQNFDTLPPSTVAGTNLAIVATAATAWKNDTTLSGWWFGYAGAATFTLPAANTGFAWTAVDGGAASSLTLNSIGVANGTDRAIGSPTTTARGEQSIYVLFKNDNTKPMDVTRLAYDAEVWRTNTNLESIFVSWKTFDAVPTAAQFTAAAADATLFPADVATGPNAFAVTGWNALSGLTFTEPADAAVTAISPGRVTSKEFAPASNAIRVNPGKILAVRFSNVNDSGTDATMGIDNFSANFVEVEAPSLSGSFVSAVRNPGASLSDPADDTVTATVRVVANNYVGATGWTSSFPVGGSAGAYGSNVVINYPVAAAPTELPFVIQDDVDGTLQDTIIIPTPAFIRPLTTDAAGLGINFEPSSVGDVAYVSNQTAGSQLSWSGGTAAAGGSNVVVQPTPGTDPNKYFHFQTNVNVVSEVLDANAIKGFPVVASGSFGFYSTSGTDLDLNDTFVTRVEIAQDGNFTNTANGNIITSDVISLLGTADTPDAAGASSCTDIAAIATPGHVNLTTFLSDPWILHNRSSIPVVIPATATNPRLRMVVTGTGITASEHLIVDNLNLKVSTEPVISLGPITAATWSNNGTIIATDDTFTATGTVTAVNVGVSTGFTTSAPVVNGTYGAVSTFGPYPGNADANITITDSLNAAVSGMATVTQPAHTIGAGVPVITRNANDAGVVDDTVTVEIPLNSSNVGPQFTAMVAGILANLPSQVVATVIDPAYPAAGGSATVTLSNLPATATTVNLVLTDASYPTATATVAVAIPAAATTDSIVGTYNVGAGVVDLMGGTLDPLWINFPGTKTTVIAPAAAPAAPALFTSAPITTGGAALRFTATLRASEESLTSNFEQPDKFRIRLLVDGQTVEVPNTRDVGDGASTGAQNDVPNGAPDGFLNGFAGIATVAPAPVTTVAENYLANVQRDEFNIAGETVATRLDNLITFSANIPAGSTSVVVQIEAVGLAGSEAFSVQNLAITPVVAGADTDMDGIADDYEALNGLTVGVNDAALDRDGDGSSNLAEFQAGTAANDPNSRLKVTDIVAAGANYNVTFASVPGKMYKLQWSTAGDLPVGPWIDVPGVAPQTATAVSTGFSVPAVALTGSRGFVRVALVNP